MCKAVCIHVVTILILALMLFILIDFEWFVKNKISGQNIQRTKLDKLYNKIYSKFENFFNKDFFTKIFPIKIFVLSVFVLVIINLILLWFKHFSIGLPSDMKNADVIPMIIGLVGFVAACTIAYYQSKMSDKQDETYKEMIHNAVDTNKNAINLLANTNEKAIVNLAKSSKKVVTNVVNETKTTLTSLKDTNRRAINDLALSNRQSIAKINSTNEKALSSLQAHLDENSSLSELFSHGILFQEISLKHTSDNGSNCYVIELISDPLKCLSKSFDILNSEIRYNNEVIGLEKNSNSLGKIILSCGDKTKDSVMLNLLANKALYENKLPEISLTIAISISNNSTVLIKYKCKIKNTFVFGVNKKPMFEIIEQGVMY